MRERLISADALLRALPDDLPYKGSVRRVLMQAPEVDAVPVVHGRWIEQEDPMLDVYYTCSVCKEDFYIETTGYTEKDMFVYTYCPNCGAKMDGGDGNEA